MLVADDHRAAVRAAAGQRRGIESEPGGEIARRLHVCGIARNEHAAQRFGRGAVRTFVEVEQGDLAFPRGRDRAADDFQCDTAVGEDAIEREADFVDVCDERDRIFVGPRLDYDVAGRIHRRLRFRPGGERGFDRI